MIIKTVFGEQTRQGRNSGELDSVSMFESGQSEIRLKQKPCPSTHSNLEKIL